VEVFTLSFHVVYMLRFTLCFVSYFLLSLCKLQWNALLIIFVDSSWQKKEDIAFQTFYSWLWVSRTRKQDQNERKMTRDFEVVDEICNNVKSCNMTTMSPLKLAKIVCEKD